MNKPVRRRRGHKQLAPIEERAYYTRQEVCDRFGFNAKYLAELIANDKTVPFLLNGRNQLFPKGLMDAWFEAAGARRLNIRDVQSAICRRRKQRRPA